MPEGSEASPAGDKRIRSIVILGGGTAGWMAASILARALPNVGLAITVVESPDIGTVGVGEATIPPIIDLLRFLGVDEADFVHHTKATYKLGIKFHDWKAIGHSYWHPFGTFGTAINRRPFFHAWQKARADGLAPRFNDFSLCAALGDENKFQFPKAGDPGPSGGLRYALHFDAGLVAQYLRAYAQRLGVTRLERTVNGVTQQANGFIDRLHFEGGGELPADLFIDCSGFRGVLIEQTLKAGYIDWNNLLPCDRAVAVPTQRKGPRAPYTRAWARSAGWQWRIPLQHRVGNGYVYSSAHISDAEAQEDLLTKVGETPLAEPRVLRFTAGRRRQFWIGNCVALGLASGFLEPLESTSIHLVMSGVYNLLDHFPDRDFDPANVAHYNSQLVDEIEHIRDFIVLHYCAVPRNDAALWAYCQAMELPDSLKGRIELYKATGRIPVRSGELFSDVSWFYIFEGLGITPRAHDPLMDVAGPDQFRSILGGLARATAEAARAAPPHDSWFDRAPTAAAAGAR